MFENIKNIPYLKYFEIEFHSTTGSEIISIQNLIINLKTFSIL